jgi:hypothetical protein
MPVSRVSTQRYQRGRYDFRCSAAVLLFHLCIGTAESDSRTNQLFIVRTIFPWRFPWLA